MLLAIMFNALIIHLLYDPINSVGAIAGLIMGFIIIDLADSAGLVVWAEIPFIGLPQVAVDYSNGYESNEAFHTNTKQQLIELIRQNYNHPSVVMWSLYNELQNPEGDSPVEFLNATIKQSA